MQSHCGLGLQHSNWGFAITKATLWKTTEPTEGELKTKSYKVHKEYYSEEQSSEAKIKRTGTKTTNVKTKWKLLSNK